MDKYVIINVIDLEKFKEFYIGEISNQRLSNDKLFSVVRLKEKCTIDGCKSYSEKDIHVEMLKDNWITNDLTLE